MGPFTSNWRAAPVLNSKEVAFKCRAASDCDDSDPCTIGSCSSSGCCEYAYREDCLTEGEALKTAAPSLDYVLRVSKALLEPKPSAMRGVGAHCPSAIR